MDFPSGNNLIGSPAILNKVGDPRTIGRVDWANPILYIGIHYTKYTYYPGLDLSEASEFW